MITGSPICEMVMTQRGVRGYFSSPSVWCGIFFFNLSTICLSTLSYYWSAHVSSSICHFFRHAFSLSVCPAVDLSIYQSFRLVCQRIRQTDWQNDRQTVATVGRTDRVQLRNCDISLWHCQFVCHLVRCYPTASARQNRRVTAAVKE